MYDKQRLAQYEHWIDAINKGAKFYQPDKDSVDHLHSVSNALFDWVFANDISPTESQSRLLLLIGWHIHMACAQWISHFHGMVVAQDLVECSNDPDYQQAMENSVNTFFHLINNEMAATVYNTINELKDTMATPGTDTIQ